MTLPELYHAHHSSDEEDILFWMGLAENQGGPILELGCGTGRVLSQLVVCGYQVIGLDLDGEMLTLLRKNLLRNLAPAPYVFQADMSAFRLAARFPLIVLPCNTLSTLSPIQRNRTLKNAAEHLAQGGRFAASIPNPAVLAKLPETGESELEDIFPHPVDGEPVQVSSSWMHNLEKFTLQWHYDHLLPDGNVKRLTAETCHQIQPIQAYMQEIQQAGLLIKYRYGDFNCSDYNNRSPYFIFVAGLA
jgi:SAM-dependent methyltransferase